MAKKKASEEKKPNDLQKLELDLYVSWINSYRDHLLKLAIDEAKTAGVELKKFDRVLFSVRAADDRVCGIIAGGYADIMLKNAYEKHFRRTLSSENRMKMLDFSGPLGNLSNRIHLARAFDWIDADTYSVLDKTRTIRNEFAHEIDVNSFQHPDIQKHVVEMAPVDRNLRELLSNKEFLLSETDINLKSLFLCRYFLACSFGMCTALSGPILLRYGFHPGQIISMGEDAPAVYRNIISVGVHHALSQICDVEKFTSKTNQDLRGPFYS